jgi:vancomycin resistance protein YoaR
MFRAAVSAGLKITERYPHSFPVAFYNPQGFDATVYPPSVDLKFVNDTSANILIQTKIEGSNLTFEIYGTKDREVKVTTPEEYDKKFDGSMKAKFTQEIWQDGELARSKTFYSVYKSPRLFPEIRNPLE